MNAKIGKKEILIKAEDKIIVKPRTDFWALAGSLKSQVKLTDRQLKEARLAFGKQFDNQYIFC